MTSKRNAYEMANIAFGSGGTSLWFVKKTKDVTLEQLALRQLNLLANSGPTAFKQALENRDIEVTKDILFDAVAQESLDTLDEILNCGRFDVNDVNKDGYTALGVAAYDGKLNVVKIMLGNPNVNPFSVDSNGDNVLHCAVQGESTDVVSFLLSLEIATELSDKRNHDEKTPEDLAIEQESMLMRLFGKEALEPDSPPKQTAEEMVTQQERGLAVYLTTHKDGEQVPLPDVDVRAKHIMMIMLRNRGVTPAKLQAIAWIMAGGTSGVPSISGRELEKAFARIEANFPKMKLEEQMEIEDRKTSLRAAIDKINRDRETRYRDAMVEGRAFMNTTEGQCAVM